MDHPSQLFSRIRRQKARPDLPRQGHATVAPAPAPIRAAATYSPAGSAPPSPAPFRTTAPQAQAGSPPPSPAPFRTAAPQAQAGSASPPAAPDKVNLPEPPIPPRPARGHALYSQVMRSHDRMGTRHV